MDVWQLTLLLKVLKAEVISTKTHRQILFREKIFKACIIFKFEIQSPEKTFP